MKRTRDVLLGVAGGACLSALVASGTARAQGSLPETVAARGLYDQAALAIGRKDYAAACPMLEEALRLEPAALGARLALAECYEAGDRLASAWGMYGIVEQEAIKAKQPDRAQRARERAAALEPRLARLVIEVPEAVSRLPGLVIKRDGVPVGRPQWGVPLPADKGSHLIAVETQGKAIVVLVFEVLADGVTARATLPEPAPASPLLPWWEQGSPRPAPRPIAHRLPELRPPPPKPVPGIPTVLLEGPEGIELCEIGPSGAALGCSEERERVVDARAGQAFVLRGDRFLDSKRFRLDDQLGRVRIGASPARRGVSTLAVVLMSLGAAATLGCGVGLPVAVRSANGTAPGVGGGLAGGLVALAVGIPLFVLNRTTYTLSAVSPSPGDGGAP